MVQEKKEYLEAFALQKYVPIECVKRVSYAFFIRGIFIEIFLGARCVFIS